MQTRFALVGLVLALAACDAQNTGFSWDAISGDSAVDWSWDVPHDGSDVTGPTTVMRGTVYSPGHIVPISGALVYFGFSEPPAIPSGAYPETCEDPPSPFFTLSAPNGAFELMVSPGTYKLVVQKGQFRRVRDITVPEGGGPVDIDTELTTLPNRNGTGDTIPSMALVFAMGGGDHIEDVLAKLTMGSLGSDNALVLGTEQFDIYNISPYQANTALLGNLSTMLEYHIIFFPCTIDGSPQLNDPTGPLSDATVKANIRAFLDAGGKVYATDMMYDVFEQVLPIYVDICGDDATMNDGDETAWSYTETAYGWTSSGWSSDSDLSAWLDAIGVGAADIDFMDNFVWIEGLYAAPPDAPPGDPVTPKVWVYGDFVLDAGRTLPLTVTFPVGAGKVLFSTYHTVGDGGYAEILPQEYVLVYLIMEIGVCQSGLY